MAQEQGGTMLDDRKDKSPILLPLWVAVLSLFGGVLVAAVQGCFNTQIEKGKSQASLILKAIETGDVEKSATNLRFLIKAGLLKDPSGKLSELLEQRDTIPVLPPSQGSLEVHATEPGVVEVASADTVELSCGDPAHPEALIQTWLDQRQLLGAPAGVHRRVRIPALSPGIHMLWWSVDTISSTLACEVFVNGVVRHRRQVSPEGANNGSLLLRVN